MIPFSTDLPGALPDGTPYRIALPPDWNRTLLLDLDFVGPPGAPPGQFTRGCSAAATEWPEPPG
jgi:hypothetical protein